VQAYHGHNGARDHRWHPVVDPLCGAARARVHPPDYRADERIDETARDDGAKRDAYVGIRATTRVPGHRDDPSNEGKAGPQVARDATANKEEENECTDARHQNGDVGIEAHQYGSEYGRAEHGDDVLSAHRNVLGPRHTLVGLHDDTGRGTLDLAPPR